MEEESKVNGGVATVETPAGVYRIGPCSHGKGCFAGQNLPQFALVGVYPGIIINERQLSVKLSKLPTLQHQEQVSAYLVHSKLHSTPQSKCYLDPTNDFGTLDANWSHNPVLYINEPDVGQVANVQPVWNYDRDRLELWTSHEVKQGDQLLVNYGCSYSRNYATSTGESGHQDWHFVDGKLHQTDLMPE